MRREKPEGKAPRGWDRVVGKGTKPPDPEWSRFDFPSPFGMWSPQFRGKDSPHPPAGAGEGVSRNGLIPKGVSEFCHLPAGNLVLEAHFDLPCGIQLPAWHFLAAATAAGGEIPAQNLEWVMDA